MTGQAGPVFTLREGRLYRHEEPFFSVGFNYHPSPTGCQYWRQWDPARIDADLARMAELGFNTIRFFLFWVDFEPRPGEYDQTLTARLEQFVEIAGRHGLACLPSLLTIWMNGQRFDPPWRQGGDLWRDPALLAQEQAFVHHVAGTLRGAGNVLAYDLGDEVIYVDAGHSRTLPRVAVRAWWALLAGAIRDADPGALVLQANDASAVVADHHFRPENADALDLVGLHGFPVWSPFHIEAVASPKASALVPYLVSYGRASTAVLVDELGSYGCDEATAAGYLRA